MPRKKYFDWFSFEGVVLFPDGFMRALSLISKPGEAASLEVPERGKYICNGREEKVNL